MNKNFHGLVLIDKPSGITSHDVVARLRRLLGTKGVGHSGTLDPLASGLMVCLVNEGTKLSQYILEGDKAYRVRAQLGLRTDTLDTTGTVLEENPARFSQEQIEAAAQSLAGEFEWPVPIFSAVKVQGQKLYDYARKDQAVEVPKKRMCFYDIRCLGVGEENGRTWADYELKCSKGSYIRSWVDELGKKLGPGAAMSALRRIWSAPYEVDQALTLEALEAELQRGKNLERGFVSLGDALPQAKKIRVKGQDEVLLRNGQISHDLRGLLIGAHRVGESEPLTLILSQESQRVLALVALEPGKGFVLRRVFHYEGDIP